jgi:hypothetical protein
MKSGQVDGALLYYAEDAVREDAAAGSFRERVEIRPTLSAGRAPKRRGGLRRRRCSSTLTHRGVHMTTHQRLSVPDRKDSA